MTVLADDDVVVHGNAERGGDLDDRLGHMDIGLRGRGIAGGRDVHRSTARPIALIHIQEQRVASMLKITGVWVSGRFHMLNRDEPSQARGVFVGNRRSHQITESESTSILVLQKFAERMIRIEA